MASQAAGPSPLQGEILDETEVQQNEVNPSQDQRPNTHLQGWALVSLTIAFMAICFVLALDNTILGTQT